MTLLKSNIRCTERKPQDKATQPTLGPRVTAGSAALWVINPNWISWEARKAETYITPKGLNQKQIDIRRALVL